MRASADPPTHTRTQTNQLANKLSGYVTGGGSTSAVVPTSAPTMAPVIGGGPSPPTAAPPSGSTGVDLRWLPFILGYLSFLRPAFEILMVNELDGLGFEVTLVDDSGAATTDAIPLSGNVVLAQLGLSVADIPLDFGLLVMWLALFTGAASALLELRVVERR